MEREEEATRTRVVVVGGKERLVVEGAVLLVEGGPDAGRELEMPQHAVVLGRGATADFRLADRTVSREHVRIEPVGDGWRVLDLGSKSGVRLAGLRVADAELPFDTPLEIGDSVLLLRALRKELPLSEPRRSCFHGMLGACPAMVRLFGMIERLARLDLPVLIQGETGTGKEQVAHALHLEGGRAETPYRVVDCTLLADENQARSELFGHMKGSFTGADRDRVGAFREAHGGTLFLDEVGELPLAVQPLLLRALQEGEVRALGSDRVERVRVRVVAATHRDLAAEVARGAFRQDLYHRIACLVLEVPPLRERGEDLDLLARAFLPEGVGLEPAAWGALRGGRWLGNVRELKQTLERAAALREGARIRRGDLGPDTERGGQGAGRGAARGEGATERGAASVLETARSRLAKLTDEDIEVALAQAGGNRERAAAALGISPASLYRRLRRLRGLE